MDRIDIANVASRLRATVRPLDLIGRVRLLVLAFALANLAGVALVASASTGSRPVYFAGGMLVAPVLAIVWIASYRRHDLSVAADVIVVAALCVSAVTVDARWNDVVVALLTASVFFGSAYGSARRVLIRTSLVSAISLGVGMSDPTSFEMAVGFVVGFGVVSTLMHGMVSSILKYEATALRERTLAATGLELVASGSIDAIVSATLQGAQALCGDLPCSRIGFLISEGDGGPPRRYKVRASVGERVAELNDAIFEADQLCPEDPKLVDQHIRRVEPDTSREPSIEGSGEGDGDASEPTNVADPHDMAPSGFGRLFPGEVLVTPIRVFDVTRGALLVEARGRIADYLPAAVRTLTIQASLAISRLDAQHLLVEQESSERFEALIQHSTDVISIVSTLGDVMFQSPSVRQIFGYDKERVTGAHLSDMVHPEDTARVVGIFNHVVGEKTGFTALVACRVRHADGSWVRAETRMTNLIDVAAVNGVVLNSRDVSDRHALEAELRHQAFHDTLTGLANRGLFSNRVEHALAASTRDNHSIAVLYCALTGLKRVNDSLGYAAGDDALLVIADRLKSSVRGNDTVARMGGNEFAILLERLTSPTDATMAMERIMALLRQPIQLPGAQIEFQPHIGIAVSSSAEECAEDLLRDAAVAMHQARREEGSYALFDPEMHQDAIRRIEVESQLRTALDESQFILYYQPTIDLQTGRLTGVEALVRWQHPTRGIVPPMEFIPLAEESGLIVPLGQWTIREACRQVRFWQKEIPADEPIALNVNLSARQLRHPDIVRDVADALDDSGLLPSRLILEITESVLMIDTAATISRLLQLKSLGVRLAIDDFGTGYSSFAYLRRFPVDIIKIDKSFVDDIATEETATALVDAMIRIGKTLRLETVAEGVELVEQADRLRTLHCDIGQGYLFSRPLPSDSISTFLRKQGARVAEEHAA